ncbi:MAG: hypothetical protein ACRCYE_15805 [Sarcina sp.]
MKSFFINKVALAMGIVSTLAIGIILVASNLEKEDYIANSSEAITVESIQQEDIESEMNTYLLEQRNIDRTSVNELPNYIIAKIDSEGIEKTHDIIHIVIAGEYTIEELKKIAEKEMEIYTSKSNVDTLTVGFYEKLNQIGQGYEMGYIEYYLDKEFDANFNEKNRINEYNFINELKFPVKKSEEDINISAIKRQIECKIEESIVDIKKDGVFLRVEIKENNQEKVLNEFTIAKYTDIILENKLNGIEYIEIKVKSDIKSIEAVLKAEEIQEQNGKYFDIDYIRNNIK